jgi:hypothetical protein
MRGAGARETEAPAFVKPGFVTRIEADAEEDRKRFFLEKEAKTFAHWGTRCVHRVPQCAKVFWFFFSKKNCLPSLPLRRLGL